MLLGSISGQCLLTFSLERFPFSPWMPKILFLYEQTLINQLDLTFVSHVLYGIFLELDMLFHTAD